MAFNNWSPPHPINGWRSSFGFLFVIFALVFYLDLMRARFNRKFTLGYLLVLHIGWSLITMSIGPRIFEFSSLLQFVTQKMYGNVWTEDHERQIQIEMSACALWYYIPERAYNDPAASGWDWTTTLYDEVSQSSPMRFVFNEFIMCLCRTLRYLSRMCTQLETPRSKREEPTSTRRSGYHRIISPYI